MSLGVQLFIVACTISGSILHAQTIPPPDTIDNIEQSTLTIHALAVQQSDFVPAAIAGTPQETERQINGATSTVLTYICDYSNYIYSINPITGQILSRIGPMPQMMTDIAFDLSGTLYGTDGNGLYRINASTGATTYIGSHYLASGYYINSMEFRADGVLFAAGQNYIYTLNKSTGTAAIVDTMYSKYQAGGDIAFDSGNNFYLITNDGYLIRYSDPPNGGVVVGSTGINHIWGLIYRGDGYLYGFTRDDEIYRISPQNATATPVGNIDSSVNKVSGATTRTVIPPPGKPTLISPGTDTVTSGTDTVINPRPTITTLAPSLTWTAVPGATDYAVYVFDLNSQTVVYINENVGNVTSFALPAGKLEARHNYVWYMRASNSSGFSDYSAYFYFQTSLLLSSGEGVDYAFSRPKPKCIKSAGNQFVVRYLYPPQTGGKGLTASEVLALRKERLDVVFCFEYYEGRMKEGYNAGVADAKTAINCAASIKAPEEFFCYFACDFPAGKDDQAAINAYLDGAASILGISRVGFYGGYGAMQRVLDAGKASAGWQTYAWSSDEDGQPVVDSRVSLYQYKNMATIACGTVDLDHAYESDLGQWSITEPVIIATILQNAYTKQSYSASVDVIDGTGVAPYKWSLIPGDKLPVGMKLNATTGVISGKPTKAGMFFFTIKVTDAIKQTDTKQFSLIVN